MDEKYETIYAFKEESEKDIWYDYSMMLNLHMQRMKIRIFLFGFHDMQKTIQQIKLSS